LEWPLFPEAHKDYHDFKPAPCFDKNGKFMDRCNPMAKNAAIEAQDKASASKYNPVADAKKEEEKQAEKEAAAKAKAKKVNVA
jgi:hypothetical protein